MNIRNLLQSDAELQLIVIDKVSTTAKMAVIHQQKKGNKTKPFRTQTFA
jgi:hypothetical protein